MALKFATFLSPPLATTLPPPDTSSPDSGLWQPLSCTLVYTPTSAIIIDCPTTVPATRDLAAWIKGTLPEGCTLKWFLTTHAHGDHFFGFPILKDNFSGIQAVASRYVIEGVASQYAPDMYEGVWKVGFPDLDERRVDFEALPESNEIDLDGNIIKVIDIQHADTHNSSFVHVPALGLVVAGDVAYNGDCYQYLAEANNAERRAEWIKAISEIIALNPKVVIPGHSFHVRSEPDAGYAKALLESNITYIRAFEEELEKAADAKELFELMQKRFKRWNLWILNESCKAAFAGDA